MSIFKIIKIFFVVLFLLLTTSFINAQTQTVPETYLLYYTTAGLEGYVTAEFASLELCNKRRTEILESNASFLSTAPKITVSEKCIKKSEAKPLGEEEAIETNTTYTLLAPLPGLETFESDPQKQNGSCAFGNYLNVMIKLILGIAAVLAMIMLIKGGFEYMGSSLPSEKESGKGTITNAIFGLLLALGAYLLLYTINPDLLNFCNIGTPIKIEEVKK